MTEFVRWLPRLASSIVILFAFWLMWRLTRAVMEGLLERANLDRALARMILSAYRFTVMVFGMIVALDQVGINVGAALTGLGVVGLTIGFAARDSLSNIMAGFLILWDKPFHSGDWITLGDQYGKVEEITMRTTRLVTWSNTRVIVPNEAVINQVLVNHSSHGRTRIEVPITLPDKGDVGTVRQAIAEAVVKIEGVLTDPPPDVVINAVGVGGTDLLIHAWVKNAEQEQPTRFKILEVSKPLVTLQQ